MKGLEKITQRIRDDAQAEIQAILDEGRAKAEAVLEDYRTQAQQLLDQEQQRTEQAAAELLERGSRSDAMDGSKAQLAAKQACVDEAFAQAGRALQQMPREKYIRVLARMAAQAGEGSEELIFSPADAQAVGQAVVEEANRLKAGASFTLSPQQRDMEGGLVLKKGDVEINCDFATQLRLLRQSMAADVAAMLFS